MASIKNTLMFIILASVLASAADDPKIPVDAFKAATTSLLCMLYDAAAKIVGFVAILVLIWAGLRWISSRDDPGQRKQALDIIKAVLVGLVLVAAADYFVVAIKNAALGTNPPATSICP